MHTQPVQWAPYRWVPSFRAGETAREGLVLAEWNGTAHCGLAPPFSDEDDTARVGLASPYHHSVALEGPTLLHSTAVIRSSIYVSKRGRGAFPCLHFGKSGFSTR